MSLELRVDSRELKTMDRHFLDVEMGASTPYLPQASNDLLQLDGAVEYCRSSEVDRLQRKKSGLLKSVVDIYRTNNGDSFESWGDSYKYHYQMICKRLESWDSSFVATPFGEAVKCYAKAMGYDLMFN